MRLLEDDDLFTKSGAALILAIDVLGIWEGKYGWEEVDERSGLLVLEGGKLDGLDLSHCDCRLTLQI